MTIANFERFDLAPCSTIAFSRFKKHHTELNDIYWSFACSHAYTKKTTRGSSDADIPAQVLLLTGADTRRAPETMREWRTDFESFANWARLSMIMSASSYFEVYMREVFRLALQSDPLLVHGLSGELDGVILLKSGKRIDQSEAIDRCCKGEWNARASNIIKVFGSIPSDIQANLTELDSIRKLRNTVGHQFGREIAAISSPNDYDSASERLGQDRLKKWLGIIESTAESLDDFLKSTHIGPFEYFEIYHTNQQLLRSGEYGRRSPPKAFAYFVDKHYKQRVAAGFCRSLINHYNCC